MNAKLLWSAVMAAAVMSAVGLAKPSAATAGPYANNWWTDTWWTTPQPTSARPRENLYGKMITISSSGGTVNLYPHLNPFPSPVDVPHGSRWRTTSPPPASTQSPGAGWTVCLRYLTDYLGSPTQIFSLGSSGERITFSPSGNMVYALNCNRYRYEAKRFVANIRFLAKNATDMWFSVCVTVDSAKDVAQVFSGSNMSIRKMLPSKCQWRGEPVITFSGFDGQVTDVQMWDYPLSYGEVTDYLSSGAYKLYRGSVFTWSDATYNLNGYAALEDVYEIQEQEHINRRGRGRRPKGLKRKKKVFNLGRKRNENNF